MKLLAVSVGLHLRASVEERLVKLARFFRLFQLLFVVRAEFNLLVLELLELFYIIQLNLIEIFDFLFDGCAAGDDFASECVASDDAHFIWAGDSKIRI